MAKGLGAGLGALLGEDSVFGEQEVSSLPISKIEPRARQPRIDFDEESLLELSDSISQHGVIQPVIVRPLRDGYYQIIAGERRWRAARMAGLTEVPVRVIDADEQQTAELALIENLQREDLNIVEEARGYEALMEEFGLTQESVSKRVGKSRPVIANALRLLKLPEEVLELLKEDKLTLSHARAILELEDPERQIECARQTAEKGLSVRETTTLVKKAAGKTPERPKVNHRISADGVDYMSEIEAELTGSMGRKVRIEAGAKRGRFEIEYYGQEDFEALYRALKSVRGEKNET